MRLFSGTELDLVSLATVSFHERTVHEKKQKIIRINLWRGKTKKASVAISYYGGNENEIFVLNNNVTSGMVLYQDKRYLE